jgi:hypothetical protein
MREATENEKRRVREYVNSQSPPQDQVTFLQKVGARKVGGITHHLFDVRTESGRWWVIGDPMMNLYSQGDFQSIDVALTFHIGLCVVLAERTRKESGGAERRLLVGTWRRFESAVDAFNDAHEAEAFQAVGIVCRETLLTLVREESKSFALAAGEERPKRDAFKAWSAILLKSIPHDEIRSYMTTVANKTWDLVVWLQHCADATQADAEIALDATRNFITSYATIRLAADRGLPEKCPRCGSYVLEDASHEGDSGWVTAKQCVACGWHSEAELPTTGE